MASWPRPAASASRTWPYSAVRLVPAAAPVSPYALDPAVPNTSVRGHPMTALSAHWHVSSIGGLLNLGRTCAKFTRNRRKRSFPLTRRSSLSGSARPDPAPRRCNVAGPFLYPVVHVVVLTNFQDTFKSGVPCVYLRFVLGSVCPRYGGRQWLIMR